MYKVIVVSKDGNTMEYDNIGDVMLKDGHYLLIRKNHNISKRSYNIDLDKYESVTIRN